MNTEIDTIKTKKKKTTLKKFSPMCVESSLITWSTIEAKIISRTKKRYSFNHSFDLHDHLSRMDTEIKTLEEYDRQTPSQKETDLTLKTLKKQMIPAQNVINAMIKPLLNGDHNHLANLLEMLKNTGSKHRKIIATNSSGGFETLHQVCQSLELLVDDNPLIILAKNLEQLTAGVAISKANQKKSKRGRKPENLEKGIIHHLLYIYIEGTSNKKAICSYHPEKDKYYGDFYYFVLIAISLLRRKVSIKTLKTETWGSHAREVIRYHYRKKQPPSAQ